MSKRLIDTDLWNNEDIIESFTAEDRYFWLYLLTNPHNSICGVMKASPALIARDMGYSKESIQNLLYRFENIHKAIKVDKETSELVVLNWAKFNWTKSPKLLQTIKDNVEKIKSVEIQSFLLEKINQVFEGEKVDTVSIRYRYGTITNTNIIYISISNIYNTIKECYSKYGYSSRLNKKETCKRLTNIISSTKKEKHLYSLEIIYAYACYLKEKSEANTEAQYIKHSAEFLTSMVYDYADKIQELFLEKMVEKYGENWHEIKYEVVE